MALADNACIPCRGNVPPVVPARAQELLSQLDSWHINTSGHLERNYKFADFARALEFVNIVGAIAEAEGHHPDLYLSWGKCRVEIWTHAIQGLTESDFFLAAKADRAFGGMRT